MYSNKKKMDASEPPLYKILLLGDSTVGKTCFLLRYVDDSFLDLHMATIGLDYRLKTLILEEQKIVKVQLWDTAGQDKFRAITRNYYKGASGIILIFDVTNVKSYENIKKWINEIKEEIKKEEEELEKLRKHAEKQRQKRKENK